MILLGAFSLIFTFTSAWAQLATCGSGFDWVRLYLPPYDLYVAADRPPLFLVVRGFLEQKFLRLGPVCCRFPVGRCMPWW